MRLVQGHGINDMPYGWASENEWNKMVYRKWQKMLYRCYNEEFHKRQPTYIGCTVCERWLTLSDFIEDVPKITGYDEEKFLNGELELDKDKKKDENKHYTMKYCTWLLKPENSSLAHKGKLLSKEHKQKISDNNAMKGKFGSEHNRSKRIAQYDKQTNELIKIWGGIREVERELGISHGNISACCKGKLKSAGGFVWKYVGGD